jgi:threonyl-tRNA synthetase
MPVQVVVLPVRDDHDDYARATAARLGAAGVRVEVDVADEPLNARIRRWKLQKVPYILVAGDDDVTAGTVGVNARSSERAVRDVALDDFLAALMTEIDAKGSPEPHE